MASASPPRFILLLPPLPTTPTLSNLQTAFGETLRQVLRECASQSLPSAPAILEIAVATPALLDAGTTSRAALYPVAQTTLAAVYRLVCVVATREAIELAGGEGVDVRVLLVAWAPPPPPPTVPDPPFVPDGMILDLARLATSGRQWAYAFGVESADGEAFVRAFVAAKQQQQQQSPSSSSSPPQVSRNTQPAPPIQQHHSHVAVGGTFDHLHIGHKLLLQMTLFLLSSPPAAGSAPTTTQAKLTIGITAAALLASKRHAAYLESWDVRRQRVQEFLSDLVVGGVNDGEGGAGAAPPEVKTPGILFDFVPLHDPFGPTITDRRVSALVVSGETRGGGAAVNARRGELGWEALEVFEVEVLDGGTAGEQEEGGKKEEEGKGKGFEGKISSTAIRERLAALDSSASLTVETAGERGGGGGEVGGEGADEQ
nr:phosphopantetheine adenylyltransferase 1 [Quercus suber]